MYFLRQSKIGNRKSKIELLDHLVRPRQHIRRNRQADLFGCFQIDHELELRRGSTGKIGRLGAFQNFVHIRSGAPIASAKSSVRTTADHPRHNFTVWINSWEPIFPQLQIAADFIKCYDEATGIIKIPWARSLDRAANAPSKSLHPHLQAFREAVSPSCWSGFPYG